MNLERALVELGREVAFPPEPQVAARVGATLRAGRPERLRHRRGLAIAFAALVVALAVAFAVPPARSAILELLRLRGVTIERVEDAGRGRPAFDRATNRALGVQVSLEEATRRAGFRLLVPSGEHPVTFDGRFAGGAVTFGWPDRRLFLTEFVGEATPYIEKQVGLAQRVDRVEVAGGRGYWIEGAHSVIFRTARGNVLASRAAGNVLLWEQGEVTLRLEGAVSKAEALRIAGTLRRGPV